MRILFALPGLHRVHRGAEAAFEKLAEALAAMPDLQVTLIGSGDAVAGRQYTFIHAGLISRERFRRWPSVPPLRSEYRYEEMTFVPGLWRAYEPGAYDLTISCSYPFVQWVLLAKKRHGRRPPHIFVTENGDWAARRTNAEYRRFRCEGLVCTNPEYYQRHKDSYPCALIPNGIDTAAFTPGPDERLQLKLPAGKPLILMVSALIPSKHPLEGIRCAAQVEGASLVIAGDGPLQVEADALGRSLLGDRYKRISLGAEQMPALYRSADVLLHMSREEAFGNIYIEAAACALPVVAHDYETTHWIFGKHAALMDTEKTELVVQALRNAAAADAEEMAACAASVADRFNWPHIAEQYAAFFSSILQR